MKIALFTETIIETGGGSQYTVLAYAKTLREMGNEVEIYTPGKPYKDVEKETGCKVIALKKLTFINITFDYKKAEKELLRFSPDIIHLNELFSSFYIGLYFSKKFKIPHIVSFHTFYKDNIKTGFKYLDNFLGIIANFYSAQLLKMCEVITTPTSAVADYLRNSWKLNNQLRIIYCPVIENTNLINTNKRTRGKEYKLISATRLFKGKEVEKGIEAIAYLKNLPITLTIVGSGPYKNKLQELIINKGLSEKVRIISFIQRKELLNKYKEFDGFLNTSTMETFGITYIEALAQNLDLICIKYPITEEVLEGFKNVYFSSTNNAEGIAKAIRKAYESPTIDLNNPENFDKYSYARVTSNLLNFYEDAIKSTA